VKRLVAVCGAAVLICAASSGAAIVVQRGMAGLKLGDSWSHARAHFATPPDSNSVVKSEILGKIRVARWGHVTISFDGTKASSKIIAFDTTGTAQRTSNGVGVGSTKATVMAKLPRAKCKSNDAGYNHCYIGKFGVPGATVTDFSINARGRVGRVTVGIVED
jgi:hypothetical protein